MDKMYLTITGHTNRQDWGFDYPTDKIAEAAKKQKAYRESRVEAWEAKKKELLAKIKEEGLNVHESVLEKMSTLGNSYNPIRNRGVQISINDELQQDLDEAFGKVKEHRDLVAQYDAWIQVLEANPHRTLTLKHHDWMFFFGK